MFKEKRVQLKMMLIVY